MNTALRIPPVATQVVWGRLTGHLAKVDVPLFIDHAPYAVEKSGEIFAVVQRADSSPLSTGPMYHRTLSRSRIALNVYADCSRDEAGVITMFDAESRATAVYEHVDPLIGAHTSHTWPEVISSDRVGEPRIFRIPDSEALFLNAIYDITLIGSIDYASE